jgi:hypothetical protein
MAFMASWTAPYTMASVRVIWTGFCPFAVTALSAVSFHVRTSLASAGSAV